MLSLQRSYTLKTIMLPVMAIIVMSSCTAPKLAGSSETVIVPQVSFKVWIREHFYYTVPLSAGFLMPSNNFIWQYLDLINGGNYPLKLISYDVASKEIADRIVTDWAEKGCLVAVLFN